MRYISRSCLVALALTVSGFWTISSAQTSQELTYDEAGRVSTVKYSQGSRSVVITYEYDGRSNLTMTTTRVTTDLTEDDGDLIQLRVKPNPSSSTVTVSASAIPGQLLHVRVVSASGKEVLKRTRRASSRGEMSLNFNTSEEGMSSGQYVVSLDDGSDIRSATLIVTR